MLCLSLLVLVLAEVGLAVSVVEQPPVGARPLTRDPRHHSAAEGEDENVFAQPRQEDRRLHVIPYPEWLRIVDHTLSIEALKMYNEFGDKARFWGPFSHADRPCTVKIPTYIEHPGKCVVLGVRGMTGCHTGLHLAPNHADCFVDSPQRPPPANAAPPAR